MNNRDELIDQIMCMYFDGVPLNKAIESVKDEIREDVKRKNQIDRYFELMFKNWSENN